MKKFPAKASASGWRAQARYLGALLAVAAAYFVLAKLGLQLASINPSASPIWPPTGLALAAVLLGGLRMWPAIFIGAFAANATTAGTLATSALIALGNTLEARRRRLPDRTLVGRPRDLREPVAGGEIRARLGRAGDRHQRHRRRGDAERGGLGGLDEIHPDLGHLVAGRRRRRAGGDAGDRAVGAIRMARTSISGKWGR